MLAPSWCLRFLLPLGRPRGLLPSADPRLSGEDGPAALPPPGRWGLRETVRPSLLALGCCWGEAMGAADA